MNLFCFFLGIDQGYARFTFNEQFKIIFCDKLEYNIFILESQEKNIFFAIFFY